MIKIAVPIWNLRVSPVFDTAASILVAEIDGLDVVSRHTLALRAPESRAAQLEALGIQVLLCGGISTLLRRELTNRGIRTLCHVCGATDAVLRGFAENRLCDDQFNMPGCRCRRHECRRQSARRR